MAEKKEIEIDYLNRKTKVNLPEKYSDFIELCKQTFYISKSRSENMLFYYYEDEDKIPIEEEEYKNPDVRKCNSWELVILEEEDNMDGVDQNQLKNELDLKKDQILSQIKKFKENLYKESAEKLKKEIIKRNEKQQKIIQEIKDEYINNLSKFREEIKEQNKDFIGNISKTLLDSYQQNMLLIDKCVKENIKSQMNQLGDYCKKDLDEIEKSELGQISKVNEEIKNNLKTCLEKFNKITDDKYFNLCLINANDIITTIKNEINFELNVKNMNDKIFDGEYMLEITWNDKKFEVKLDLSDIKPKENKVKKVKFSPSINEKGVYYFNLEIKGKDKPISNKSKLKLTFNEAGDMDELFD